MKTAIHIVSIYPYLLLTIHFCQNKIIQLSTVYELKKI
jgi:hypothetical protein